MPTLLRDSCFVLEHYAAPAFVRLARTAEPLIRHAQAGGSLQACRAALGTLDPSGLGILLDWRLSPATPNALQQQVILLADEFADQFARKAVLLLTPCEKGAASALWSERGVKLFDDEDAALAYVADH